MARKPASANINTHLLPPQLRVLVRVLGEPAAFRLVEHCGGGYLIVPKRFNPSHHLAELLGIEAYGKLIEEYGGHRLELTKYDAVLRQLRHQRVHSLIEQGYTIREVASATNYTTRQVINIKQAADPIEQQLGFWDEAEVEEVQEPLPTGDGLAHNPFGL